MKKIIFWILLAAPVAHAQTVSPVSVEYKKTARGIVTATNNGITPLVVVLEPASIGRVQGKPTVSKLSPDVHLDISEMSFRLPPKSSHSVTYRASCQSNCGFAIFARFTGLHSTGGLSLALHIPSLIFICSDKAKDCKPRILASFDNN
jgi:hypothetical protein